jgi:hypothetical protein
MLQRVFISVFGLLLWAHPGVAAEADPNFSAAVELPRLEAYALANNPEIRAMEQRWRAAQARPSQEGSLPDPMLNTAYHNEGFDRFEQGRSDFAWLRFGAEQELPFPGKLALKEQIAAREAEREGALYRAAVLNVLARLRVTYDEYYLAHKSIEIVRDNLELLKNLAESAKARYQVGEGLQQDVARAQVEVSTLTGRLTSLEQMRQSAAAMLNALLNRSPAEPLGPPIDQLKEPFLLLLLGFETTLDQVHDHAVRTGLLPLGQGLHLAGNSWRHADALTDGPFDVRHGPTHTPIRTTMHQRGSDRPPGPRPESARSTPGPQWPGLSGLELQDELAARGIAVPIVFMTAAPTESAQRRALAKGAVAFVEKSVALAELLEPVRRAIALGRIPRGKRPRRQPRRTR